jgi:hypothetical protein
MVGEYGDVIFTSRIYLQHEGPHGGLSTEGECSSMVEDAPVAIEHGLSKMCHGNCSRNGSERGTYHRNSLSISSTSSMLCDRVAIRCLSMRPILWSLLQYALHLNTEKLKVNRFLFGLNVSIHAKVRILMP